MTMKRVLWVDDEPWTVRPEIDFLDPTRYEVRLVSSCSAALRELKEAEAVFDLIVIDCINRVAAFGEEMDPDLPARVAIESSGISLAQVIRNKLNLAVPILFYTVRSDEDGKALALGCGGFVFYVEKSEDASAEIARVLEGATG